MRHISFPFIEVTERYTRFHFSCQLAIRSLLFIDASIFVLSAGIARVVYGGFASLASDDLAIGMLAGVIFILVGRLWGLYELAGVTAPAQQAPRLVGAVSVGVFTVVLIFFFMKTGSDHSRIVIAVFYALAVPGVCAVRFVFARWLTSAIAAGVVSGKPVVTIGEAGEFAGVGARELLHFGIDEIARIELDVAGGAWGDSDRRQIRKAVEIARKSRACEFALVMSWQNRGALDQTLELLRETPMPVRLYPDRCTRDILMKHRGRHFSPYLSVEVQREPLSRGERLAKRLFDVAVATFALLLLFPLCLATALSIRLESAGPVIFRQRRMGFDRQVFTIYKFRTMTVLEDGLDISQTRKGDARVTRIGKWLRQTSVDELPQLLNVLRGDMSLVGPRPHALAHDAEYSAKIAEYARRHHVKPGLTGAAQIRGLRGETRTLRQMSDRVEWDIWYINNWSFALDVRIFFQTFAALMIHQAF